VVLGRQADALRHVQQNAALLRETGPVVYLMSVSNTFVLDTTIAAEAFVRSYQKGCLLNYQRKLTRLNELVSFFSIYRIFIRIH
jgi:hypothetical protein